MPLRVRAHNLFRAPLQLGWIFTLHLSLSSAQFTSPWVGRCIHTWSFSTTAFVGPHRVTETCELAAAPVTYSVIVSASSVVFTPSTPSTCSSFPSYGTKCSITWTMGCSAMTSAASFIGSWVSDSGTCTAPFSCPRHPCLNVVSVFLSGVCYSFAAGADSTTLQVAGEAFWPTATLMPDMTGMACPLPLVVGIVLVFLTALFFLNPVLCAFSTLV